MPSVAIGYSMRSRMIEPLRRETTFPEFRSVSLLSFAAKTRNDPGSSNDPVLLGIVNVRRVLPVPTTKFHPEMTAVPDPMFPSSIHSPVSDPTGSARISVMTTREAPITDSSEDDVDDSED